MPATSTEIAIASTTLGSAASTITFSSIPSTYTDLRLVLVATGNTASFDIFTTFNSDSGTNYSRTQLAGDGTGVVSGRTTNSSYIYTDYGGTSTTIPNFYTLDIFSYAGSTYKTVLNKFIEDQNGTGYVGVKVALWRSTAAINTITMTTSGNLFKAGTTAVLYGIL